MWSQEARLHCSDPYRYQDLTFNLNQLYYPMFIREVRKKNPGYEKVFVYHRSIGIS